MEVIKIKSLIEFIELIPYVMQYIIPGIVGLYVLLFAIQKNISFKAQLYLGCILSYISMCFIDVVLNNIFKRSYTVFEMSLLSIAFQVCGCGFVGVIYNRNWMRKILVKLFHRTQNKSIWLDTIDFENGSNIKAYLKDKKYYVLGRFLNMEENENPYISLNSFSKWDKDTNTPLEGEPNHTFSDDRDCKIVLRLSDIDYMEIF